MSNDIPDVIDSDETEALLRDILERTETTLEPISPQEALDLYLEDKARECQQATVRSHRSRLGFFVDWCDEQGMENLNDLSARDVHEFRVWRREDLNVTSEKTQMDTLRVFVEWCETIDAVQHGLFKKIKSPVIPDGGNVRETTLTTDRANEILDYLEKYEYATVEHLTWLILVETGMRMGGAHGLDVDDYQREDEHPHLKLVHRPDTETPLKNGPQGERPVSITSEACDLIEDYLKNRRPDVADEHGRDPLLASPQGRLSKSTIRKYVYKWSRQCVVGLKCPHDRDPDECGAATDLDQASKCPSSVTPHPIRRGYITRLLKAGVPVEVVSDRCNVSPVVIYEHYDIRTEDEKIQQRREVLRNALNESDG
ncbi:tyrosine-type recombinase/integrase [Halorarum salinum]|uniref:tyrosine-type recombinase/integrase n=1 Tax=Halorarum salinum TaxID=2743089 RepID=UPI001C52DBD9|nr:site-specific integrase [Halobaculum salinum]